VEELLPSRIEALNIDATGEQRVLALDLKSQLGISSSSRSFVDINTY
jgi:hypothetical protein